MNGKGEGRGTECLLLFQAVAVKERKLERRWGQGAIVVLVLVFKMHEVGPCCHAQAGTGREGEPQREEALG